MIEAHAHIAALGFALGLPSLQSCSSVSECLEKVRICRSQSAIPAWLRLTSARPEGWHERRWPTRAELDAACPDTPCVIMSFDHHAACANSCAIERSDVCGADSLGPGAVIDVDPLTGQPTGLLLEGAAYAVWNAAPEPPPSARRIAVLAALRHLHHLGYRAVHDLHSQSWLGPLLSDLERSGELALDACLYPPIDRLAKDVAERHTWESARLRLAGGKLFADGTLNARTAHVLHPYRDPAPTAGPRGTPMASPARIADAVRTAESVGLHLAVHAIGDAAVRDTLDAIESVSDLAPDTPPSRRHRIEHCELIDEQDVPRFARLGVVCSVQPCHLLTDIEVLTRQLTHRLSRVLPLRSLIDSGCNPQGPDRAGLLWFGSDAPIVRANAEDTIIAATLRRRPDMPESGAIALEQRITRDEALRCFATTERAHA